MPITLKSGTVLSEEDMNEIANFFAESVQATMVHLMDNRARNQAKASQDSEPPQ